MLPTMNRGQKLKMFGVRLIGTMMAKWNRVRELHPPGQYCRPPPALLGQLCGHLSADSGFSLVEMN
jgi:hypothetical protein